MKISGYSDRYQLHFSYLVCEKIRFFSVVNNVLFNSKIRLDNILNSFLKQKEFSVVNWDLYTLHFLSLGSASFAQNPPPKNLHPGLWNKTGFKDHSDCINSVLSLMCWGQVRTQQVLFLLHAGNINEIIILMNKTTFWRESFNIYIIIIFKTLFCYNEAHSKLYSMSCMANYRDVNFL